MAANPFDCFRLDRRVALITGASSGLGAHFALLPARVGAGVALAARRIDKLRPLVDRIEQAGGKACALSMDVTDADSVARCFDELADWGPPDVLVNNAGMAVTKPLLEHTEADFDAVVESAMSGSVVVVDGAHLVSSL